MSRHLEDRLKLRVKELHLKEVLFFFKKNVTYSSQYFIWQDWILWHLTPSVFSYEHVKYQIMFPAMLKWYMNENAKHPNFSVMSLQGIADAWAIHPSFIAWSFTGSWYNQLLCWICSNTSNINNREKRKEKQNKSGVEWSGVEWSGAKLHPSSWLPSQQS